LSVPFFELNREIEDHGGMSVADIIALYGQEGYRKLESDTVDPIVATHDRVVLTGAGRAFAARGGRAGISTRAPVAPHLDDAAITERHNAQALAASCDSIVVVGSGEAVVAGLLAAGTRRLRHRPGSAPARSGGRGGARPAGRGPELPGSCAGRGLRLGLRHAAAAELGR
jgi:hypothetical protein